METSSGLEDFLKKLPFDPLEYVKHLDQLPFDPNMDPGLGR